MKYSEKSSTEPESMRSIYKIRIMTSFPYGINGISELEISICTFELYVRYANPIPK